MQGKTILLISPQAWGKMFVAKHHYAIELAREGNQVYFLNPPGDERKRTMSIERLPTHPNLHIVYHNLFFPMMLRFHLRSFYDLLMKLHVRWLLKKINQSFDIVWCFEPNLYTDLRWFRAEKSVYHPVDELTQGAQIRPGEHADLIISVTHEILAKFEHMKGRKLFVNHGIAREFLEAASSYSWRRKNPVTVGYSGNLLRKDIDFNTLQECIRKFPSVRFVFWGNYNPTEANLAAADNREIIDFINFLRQSPNVELKGGVSIHTLVKEYAEVDIFLICYDIERDQSHGTNYHKVMEFLCTGRVTVSNNITTYKDSELLRMCRSRESNEEFAELLGDTIQRCEQFNSEEQQRSRKEFAAGNTYRQHVLNIGRALFAEQV